MRSLSIARIACVGAIAGVALAPPARPGDTEPGWHVIRPGDTLESLAAKYLGDRERWPEIHRLNPGIDDPHWIYPGRRMRVVLRRPSSAPNAQVTDLARRVESRPSPVPWRPAGEGDLLLDRDGLRTYEKASARLLFDDGTTATVSEDSLVFIRRQTPAFAPSPSKEIEIELGQADFEAAAPGGGAPEIEVVVGPSRSRARAGGDGTLRVRGRRQGDAASYMLFAGQGEVESDGGSVRLAAGTGTIVRADAAPLAPERLLPAPELVEPADGREYAAGKEPPVLRWRDVPGARHYVVEICLDPACGSLIERASGVATHTYRLTERPRKLAYWRVTAVAASGLDGFPSATRSMRPPLLVVRQ